MSRTGRQQALTTPGEARPTPPAPTNTPAPAQLSDSVPVGSMRFSGLVKTRTGWAVAQLEVTAEEWAALPSKKKIGRSQAFKEHVASEHKMLVVRLGQLA